YEVEVQARPLSGEDCFHIRPVTLAIGETFVNNQVFGRTGPQRGILGQRPERTASDRALFERKRPKRDVHRNTSNVDQQQYTAAERHLIKLVHRRNRWKTPCCSRNPQGSCGFRQACSKSPCTASICLHAFSSVSLIRSYRRTSSRYTAASRHCSTQRRCSSGVVAS